MTLQKKLRLHEYQCKAIDFIIRHRKCALFLDMGLGKTLTVLKAIEILKLIEGPLKVLVVGPYMVSKHVWQEEIMKWRIDLKYINLVNTVSNRIKYLKNDAEIYIINIENLIWLLNTYDVPKFIDWIVIDESSMFKDSKTNRFKEIKKHIKNFKRVTLLSGTPTPNSLLELWPQIYLLDQGERLGRARRDYIDRFFLPGQRSGYIIYNYIVKPKASTEIYSKISDICLSITNDKIKLPEKIDIIFTVSFGSGELKKYKYLKREMLLQLEQGEIDAVNAAVLCGKLQQFTNGHMYLDGKYEIIHDIKIKALKEIIGMCTNENILVFYWFKSDLDRILKSIPDAHELDVDKWNRREQKVALVHPARSGHGLNLQRGGNVMIWFSPIYSQELNSQSIARLYRQGQLDNVVKNYTILIKDSIDESIIRILSGKKRTQELLLDALK